MKEIDALIEPLKARVAELEQAANQDYLRLCHALHQPPGTTFGECLNQIRLMRGFCESAHVNDLAALLAGNPPAPLDQAPCGQSADVLAARDRHNALAGAYNRVRSVLSDSVWEEGEEAEELRHHLIRALLSLAHALGRKEGGK